MRRVAGEIRVSVEDDGIGYDAASTGTQRRGLGLFSIGERLEPFGGRMEIDAGGRRGTCVNLIVPAQPGAEEPA
jgi:signal transduction histidine kinase